VIGVEWLRWTNLTKCANLYADSSAYLRYLGGRVTRRRTRPDLLGFQVVWGSRWWHRHRHQAHSMTRKFLPTERRWWRAGR
jgi:hypothetical protein